MPYRAAPPTWKPLHRLTAAGSNYGLAAGTAFTNGTVHYEIVACSGMQKLTVRIKTATTGGTLDVFFIGPDVEQDVALKNDTAYPPAGTIYTTGNATQGAVTAGTECQVTASPQGEDFAIIKFTAGAGSGTIMYVDVASLGVGFGG